MMVLGAREELVSTDYRFQHLYIIIIFHELHSLFYSLFIYLFIYRANFKASLKLLIRDSLCSSLRRIGPSVTKRRNIIDIQNNRDLHRKPEAPQDMQIAEFIARTYTTEPCPKFIASLSQSMYYKYISLLYLHILAKNMS